MRRTEAQRKEFCQVRADQMAANMTPAEAKLWERIEPLGFLQQVTFHGQTKNGGRWSYICDFLLAKERPYICVEVDGSVHDRQKGRDRRRDVRLRGEGIRTIRFSNRRVLKDTAAVIAEIEEAMR